MMLPESKLPKFDLILCLFISYSRKDKALVDAVEERLHLLGKPIGHSRSLADTWYDQTDIEAGKDWLAELLNGLASVDAMVLFISNNSMESEWVYKEFTTAKKHNITLFPIFYKLDEVLLTPQGKKFYDEISVTQRINFTGIEPPFTSHAGLTALDEAVKKAWMQKIERQCTNLSEVQEQKLIYDLYQFDHPWVIQYFDRCTRDWVNRYQDFRAQYYVHALACLKSTVARERLKLLQEWWQIEIPPDRTHLLELAVRKPECPKF